MGVAEDLGRVSRESRYSACFDILCSIEDPGLSKRKLPQVIKLLNEALVGKVSPPKSVAEFWTSNMLVMLDPNDDGKWLTELTKPSQCKGSFGDVGPAVKRLRKAGATFADLGCLTTWSRYEASRQALQLLAESGLLEEDSLDGLHDVFLGAEPSGTEAGPKSWPLPKNPSGSVRQHAGDDPTKPLWKSGAGQAVEFSPDGSMVALAGASGPARLHDVATGNVRVICEGLKVHISHLAFSSDGSKIAVAQMYDRVCVCDTLTGKLLGKGVFGDTKSSHSEQVSGLVFSELTGEFLRSAWKQEIDVIDPNTAQARESLRPAASTRAVNAMIFYPQHDHLATVWSGKSWGEKYVTVWKWPGREVTRRFGFKSDFTRDMAITSDAKLFAFPYHRYARPENDLGVLFFDASTGVQVNEWKGMGRGGIRFLPGTNVLIAGGGPSICFGNATEPEPKASVRLCASDGEIGGIWISSDGRHSAIQTGRGVGVWTTESLLAAAGFHLE